MNYFLKGVISGTALGLPLALARETHVSFLAIAFMTSFAFELAVWARKRFTGGA